MNTLYDAVIVGSGPNGLAAAITLARAGATVLVLEAKDTSGGGTRTQELTLPGFRHDVCSSIHPLALASPFLRTLPLSQFGLQWIHASLELAHPFVEGSAATVTASVVERSIAMTAQALGEDGRAYEHLMTPLVMDFEKIIAAFLGPLRLPRPDNSMAMARFALPALLPAVTMAQRTFKTPQARALFAGMAAHAIMPLEHIATTAFGLMLAMLAHAVGWPLARGGSQSITQAMIGYLQTLGGKVEINHEVRSLADIPPARAILMDITPRQLVRIAGDQLPAAYRRQLQAYRYGPGVCKVDYALSDPIPWRSADCARSATVHLGGSMEEIARSERAAWTGHYDDQPYVIAVQPSLFDSTRAPAGKHVAWAYCHVPNGSDMDMTPAIDAQVERFAPHFRDVVLARHTFTAAQMEGHNANYIGGDINGGVQDFRQLYTRPVARTVPYSTPIRNLFICSSSTPPGGGVHGMCGYYAAQAALATVLR